MKTSTVAGCAFLSLMGGCIAAYPIDHARVSNYCATTKAGESAISARQRALDRLEFGATPNSEHRGKMFFLVYTTLSFGRYVCFVENDGSKVVTTRFNDVD